MLRVVVTDWAVVYQMAQNAARGSQRLMTPPRNDIASSLPLALLRGTWWLGTSLSLLTMIIVSFTECCCFAQTAGLPSSHLNSPCFLFLHIYYIIAMSYLKLTDLVETCCWFSVLKSVLHKNVLLEHVGNKHSEVWRNDKAGFSCFSPCLQVPCISLSKSSVRNVDLPACLPSLLVGEKQQPSPCFLFSSQVPAVTHGS